MTIKFEQRYADISFVNKSIPKNVWFLQTVLFCFCLPTESNVTISGRF